MTTNDDDGDRNVNASRSCGDRTDPLLYAVYAGAIETVCRPSFFLPSKFMDKDLPNYNGNGNPITARQITGDNSKRVEQFRSKCTPFWFKSCASNTYDDDFSDDYYFNYYYDDDNYYYDDDDNYVHDDDDNYDDDDANKIYARNMTFGDKTYLYTSPYVFVADIYGSTKDVLSDDNLPSLYIERPALMDTAADILFGSGESPVPLTEKYWKCKTRPTFASAFGSAYATATGLEEIILMLVAMALSYKVGQAFKHSEDERTVAMHVMANDYLNEREREKKEQEEDFSDNPLHMIHASNRIAEEFGAPLEVTLKGSPGDHTQLMGTFALSSKMHGAPVYTKRPTTGSDKLHYIYRAKRSGKWVVTDTESDMSNDEGIIKTNRKAELPTESLTWAYSDGSAFVFDPELVCLEGPAQDDAAPYVTITGDAGIQQDHIGNYTLVESKRINGYPLYRLQSDDGQGGTAHLYRSKDGGRGQGCWRITRFVHGETSNEMKADKAVIKSSASASLPTDPDLTWLYAECRAWHESNITVTPTSEEIVEVTLRASAIL